MRSGDGETFAATLHVEGRRRERTTNNEISRPAIQFQVLVRRNSKVFADRSEFSWLTVRKHLQEEGDRPLCRGRAVRFLEVQLRYWTSNWDPIFEGKAINSQTKDGFEFHRNTTFGISVSWWLSFRNGPPTKHDCVYFISLGLLIESIIHFLQFLERPLSHLDCF